MTFEIEELAYIRACELVGPNSPEFDALLERMELDGEIQIASFHPDYLFADAPADDPSHCTNRSPYPMLHLLREASIDKAVKAYPDASMIYEKNIDTLNELGVDGWQKLLNN